MNYTGDDNVGKRTSEEPGDPGVVGSVITPQPSPSELEESELGIAGAQATGGLAPGERARITRDASAARRTATL